MTPRTSQGESKSFTGFPLGFTDAEESTSYAGTQDACIELGVLSPVFPPLPAHLKMEMIYFVVFSILNPCCITISHYIFHKQHSSIAIFVTSVLTIKDATSLWFQSKDVEKVIPC